MKPDSPMSGSAGKFQADQVTQLWLAPSPHRNQQLFSDHYINVILPKREGWQLIYSTVAWTGVSSPMADSGDCTIRTTPTSSIASTRSICPTCCKQTMS